MKRTLALVLLTVLVMIAPTCFADELVSMTIPSFDGTPIATQEELNTEAGEWYESAVLNEDGSVTYRLTQEKRNEVIASFVAEVDKEFHKMIESEDYPNFVGIERNESFTEYTIETKSEELDLNETFSFMIFMLDSAMYHAMNGTEPDDVVVTYVNTESGMVIHEIKLSEMGE